MAVIEKSGLMKYKDAAGNVYLLYPVTTKDNIDGMEELDAHIVNTDNPHETTPGQIGAMANKGVTTEGDGAAYTATVEGITELKTGVSFVMIPNVVSTTSSPTLNVNGLGAKTIRRRVSNSPATTTTGLTEDWLSANKPITVMYDGLFWVVDLNRPNALDLLGTVDIANGGTGATDRAAASMNINYLGLSPIGSVDDDTPSNWKTIGPGFTRYTGTTLNNQPNECGTIVNLVNKYSMAVYQIFYSDMEDADTHEGVPKVYYRWGMGDTWTTDFAEIYARKRNVSVTATSTMAVGGTFELNESIANRDPVFATLAYAPAMGRMSGGTGSKTITFTNTTDTGSCVQINVACFNIDDDGLNMTLSYTRRTKITTSGNTVESNVSLQFGNVATIF